MHASLTMGGFGQIPRRVSVVVVLDCFVSGELWFMQADFKIVAVLETLCSTFDVRLAYLPIQPAIFAGHFDECWLWLLLFQEPVNLVLHFHRANGSFTFPSLTAGFSFVT